MKLISYFKDMDDESRARWRFAAGALVVAIAVFTTISVVSYFFTWKLDASSLAAGVTAGTEVSNSGASLGARWADFLVHKSFGLGVIPLLALMWAASAWLLIKKAHSLRILKWLSGCLSAAFLLSWICGFVGSFVGADTVFQSGLGGSAGIAVVNWMMSLVGVWMTGFLLVLFAVLWGFCMSKRFSDILTGRKREKEAPEEDPYDEPFENTIVEEEPEEEEVVPPVVIPAAPVVSKPVRPAVQVSTPDQPEEAPVAEEEEGGLTVLTDDTLEKEVKKPLPRIDNRLDPDNGGLPRFKFPPLDILGDYASSRHDVSQEELSRNNNKIRATLASYKIQVKDVTAIVGPTVTLYKVYPAPGVKISAIRQLQDDIAISLNAKGVRIVTLSDSVGIEVANDAPSIVPLKQLLNDEAFRNSKAELPVALGYTISQKVKVFDLADAPHVLVAGATKQGKSVGLNVIVSSLLYAKHPSELKFVFIDPKMVEFSAYGRLINHYLAVLPTAGDEEEERDMAIVKNAKSAAAVLQSLCIEMDSRYELLNKAVVNKISAYNDKFLDRKLNPMEGHRFLPYIVVVIDEYADLTMSVGAGPESKATARSITTSVIRLAQKGRAAGLHVILATQRPTVDVITGLIKANFPMRIAFRVTSRIDSSTILDQPGAEKLIGRGDMLFYSGVNMERLQCAFIDNDEIVNLTSFVGDQRGYQKSYNTPFYLPEPAPEEGDEGGGGMVDMKALDERFEEAARLIVMSQRGSTSDLQRRLGMGYAKAGRVMDQLEAAGIVGPQNGSKAREVLVKDFNELEPILARFLEK
ncbi:MAG: DNA translocase FtsK [Bacteroidales bacterium]|nr:DNA translocase FtsK [Bacteroidales bacterium]